MPFVTESNRIYYEQEGRTLAEITFPALDDTTVNIDHTFVDECLRGQGVAGRLMELAAAELERTGRKAVATCSYARRWLENHPDQAEKLQRKKG
ncbi:MAG TPA: N-acetyltransferase [Candidatus Anaerofilum excrementigallinarum]|nr:N-acetyltransferase [Candidatus Anaerofilum excrementigallinarum]